MALVLLQICCFAVTVETTTNLNVYYPDYTKIDLVCGQMPKAAQKDVEFCCEATFTGELLNDLSLITFCTINPINLVKYLLFTYKLCLSV